MNYHNFYTFLFLTKADGRLNEYREMNIVRGIGIFLVVLGHSFTVNEAFKIAHWGFLNIIASFLLPLFFLTSGFFAKKARDVRNSREYLALLKGKFHRLMIPYFVLSFVAIPLKLLMNHFALRPINLNTLLKDVFLYPSENPIALFWFIYTLFLLFLLIPLFNRISLNTLAGLLLAAYFLPVDLEIFSITHVIHYSIYFLAGIILFENYDWFVKLDNKLLLACLGLLFLLTQFQGDYGIMKKLTALLAGMGGIVCFVNVAYWLKDNYNIGTVLWNLGFFSYDIYLLSWFFQTSTRVLLYQLLHINVYLVALLMLILGVAGPILTSRYILRKIPITNRLILGR